MNATRSLMVGALLTSLTLVSGAAQAQAPQIDERRFFIEGSIGGGFLLGRTDYLPGGAVGSWSYPFVYGWAFGASGGYMLSENIGIFGSYLHSRNETRDGSITGLVDRVEGRLNYNSAVAGVRLLVPTGFGAVRGDIGVGVIFPHSRVLHYEYAPDLGQVGLQVDGTGRRIENYSVGFGGQARLGYQIPLFGPLYAAADAEFQIFQTNNAGETTEYENFVDFRAETPVPRNEVVFHGDGAAQPASNSVQAMRLLFSIGANF